MVISSLLWTYCPCFSKLPSQTEEGRDKDAEKEETIERKEPMVGNERKEVGAAAKGNKKIQSKIDNRRNKKVKGKPQKNLF